MLQDYLYLLQVMGAANPRTHKLIAHFGSVSAAAEAVRERPDFLKEGERRRFKTAGNEKSEKIIELCEKEGTRIVTLHDEDYPYLLRNIYNPPLVLFVRGEPTSPPGDIPVAVVGTREPSSISVKSCRQLCGDLARIDVTLVSGLAGGLDSVAHRAALTYGARTVGVLACGMELEYPKGSRSLRSEIEKAGGAVVTELLPYTEVTRQYFHQRNRIISGLALGTVIVEAGESSGCLITAGHAVSQNRDLFCVSPPESYAPRYRGIVSLLREGAIPVYDYTDIAREYYTRFSAKRQALIAEAEKGIVLTDYYNEGVDDILIHRSPVNRSEEKPEPNAPTFPQPEIMPERAPEMNLSALSGNSAKIARFLLKGAEPAETIAEVCGIGAEEIDEMLLDMELDGIVERAPGARYALAH